MQPKLTAKEVDFISDLMSMEESVAKKAKFYSSTLTDPKISSRMKEISENHAKRFANLLGLLQ
ncbi:MAG TPA: hypothetical protein DDW54_02045 [Clostridiales bacterium]|nr:hypothetical protein [Clostridiales bacterium]